MADFLLIYQGGDPSWRERPPAQIEAAMQAFYPRPKTIRLKEKLNL